MLKLYSYINFHWNYLLSKASAYGNLSQSTGWFQSQSYVGIKHTSGAYDQIFITVRQLQFCWYGTLSLTRGRVCRLQLLLGLASAVILGSESRETRDHILLSQIRDYPKLEGQVLVLISPRNRATQLHPQPLGPFSSPPTTRRATVEALEPASRGQLVT
jgi:hypothetical protein